MYQGIIKKIIIIKWGQRNDRTDTIKLLRECDAGIKMGIESINEVLKYVDDSRLHDVLTKCRDDHLGLQAQIQEMLDEFHDNGKEPNSIAKSMSWIKTNTKLMMNESDSTIAGLMTDGAIWEWSLINKYLNEYKAADEKTKDIAKKLIKQEERLVFQVKRFFIGTIKI